MAGRQKSISLKQLAEQLELSPGTVSFVLNGRGDEMRIASATQQRVLRAAEAAGYLLPSAAREIPLIFLFYPISVRSNLVSLIMSGIHRAVLNEDLQVELIPQPFDYGMLKKRAFLLNKSSCSGAIIVDMSDDDLSYMLTSDFDIPIVFFNRWTSKYSSVCIDSYEAGRMAAELFAAHGKESAGLIIPSDRTREVSLRETGFLDECRRREIKVLPDCILEDEESIDGGQRTAQKLLNSLALPEALFIQANSMAAGAIDYFRSHSVQIPDQLEIVSYGDNPLASVIHPTLTCIKTPIESMSRTCAEMILNMIQSGNQAPIARIFPLDIVYRDSCKEL